MPEHRMKVGYADFRQFAPKNGLPWQRPFSENSMKIGPVHSEIIDLWVDRWKRKEVTSAYFVALLACRRQTGRAAKLGGYNANLKCAPLPEMEPGLKFWPVIRRPGSNSESCCLYAVGKVKELRRFQRSSRGYKEQPRFDWFQFHFRSCKISWRPWHVAV